MAVIGTSATCIGSHTVVSRALEEQTHYRTTVNGGPTKSNMADTSGAATTITPTGNKSRCNQHQASAIENGDAPEDFGDLSPFVFVPRIDRHNDDHLARYDGEIDIPRPRTHSEVVRNRVAKLAAGRRRAELESSEVGNCQCNISVCHTLSYRWQRRKCLEVNCDDVTKTSEKLVRVVGGGGTTGASCRLLLLIK